MAIKKNTRKTRHAQTKITRAEQRKAEQLKAEVKEWARVLRCSQKRIHKAIAAGTLIFRRGRLWISNSYNRR